MKELYFSFGFLKESQCHLLRTNNIWHNLNQLKLKNFEISDKILKKYPAMKIISFDKLTYAGSLKNLEDILNNPQYPNHIFIQGDIGDGNKIKEILEKFEIDLFLSNYNKLCESQTLPHFLRSEFLLPPQLIFLLPISAKILLSLRADPANPRP